LREAHRHEKPVSLSERELANKDVLVTEEFVQQHEELLLFCVYSLVQAALRTPGTIDSDVMTALEALIQTHKTLGSGLIYETRPENAVAATVQRAFTRSLEDYQRVRAEREALSPLRDSEILAILVFLHRIGQQNQNGRPRGRMFLDLLRQMTPDKELKETASGIIV